MIKVKTLKAKTFNYADGSMTITKHKLSKDGVVVGYVRETTLGEDGITFFDACDSDCKYITKKCLIQRFDTFKEAKKCSVKHFKA